MSEHTIQPSASPSQPIARNVQNEILLIGSIYKDPDLLVDSAYYIREQYDFSDPACQFFYESAVALYQNRTHKFDKSNVLSFMTEDESRLAVFRKYGGWNTLSSWMHLANEEDFKNYMDVLKKFSLLREYERRGFDVNKIRALRNFELLKANDIYRLMRGQVDKIKTVIMPDSQTEILNSNALNTVQQCVIQPDQGTPYPFQEWNDMFRGARMENFMLIGMLSNAGKSRFLCNLVAYIALVQRQSVLVLTNEMSIQEFRFCLITTVINNPAYQSLHGIQMNKREREITLGIYRDLMGNVVARRHDEHGAYTESPEDYIARLNQSSEEFRKVQSISQWIDEQTRGKIIIKDVQGDYSDEAISFEIRRAVMVEGIKFVAYDTLKTSKDQIGEWDSFKKLATTLSELAKELKINMTATFQLTDDTALIDPLDVTTNNIANAKQIIHLCDSAVVLAEPKRENYSKYAIEKFDPEWGAMASQSFDEKKRYYIGKTLKNRAGNKLSLAYSLNLDYNTWVCEGICKRK